MEQLQVHSPVSFLFSTSADIDDRKSAGLLLTVIQERLYSFKNASPWFSFATVFPKPGTEMLSGRYAADKKKAS